MTGRSRELLRRRRELLGDARSDVRVADAVEAVAADAEARAHVFGQRVLACARAAGWRETPCRTPRRAARRETARARRESPRAPADCAAAPGVRALEFRQSRASSTSIGVRKRSPPCTTRCTTASITTPPPSRLRTSTSNADAAAPMSRQAGSARSTPSSRRTAAGSPMPVTRRSKSRAPLAAVDQRALDRGAAAVDGEDAHAPSPVRPQVLWL